MATPERAGREWLKRARDDLRAARVALDAEPPLTWVALFHAQQAAEKSLKAVLIAHERLAPRTHDLAVLLGSAVQVAPALSGLQQEADRLSPYAVDPRYPGTEDYTTEEARTALGDAGRILGAVEDEFD